MTFGSLFAGIGGMDLGLTRSGMTCKWQVEIDPFCQKVLERHFLNAKRYSDIRTVYRDITNSQGRGLGRSEQERNEQKSGRGRRPDIIIVDQAQPKIQRENCLEPVDLICGGFPCQPFSQAGQRRGKEDDRYLWDEMLRVISELKPAWIIGENVAGIISMALDEVCTSLEAQGYAVQPLIVPACAINAPHRRDRVWIIANRPGRRLQQSKNIGALERKRSTFADKQTQGSGCDIADTDDQGSQRYGEDGERPRESSVGTGTWDESWVEVATRLCRVDDGVSNRVHRLKALGNAVVPQIVEIIGRAILAQEELL